MAAGSSHENLMESFELEFGEPDEALDLTHEEKKSVKRRIRRGALYGVGPGGEIPVVSKSRPSSPLGNPPTWRSDQPNVQGSATGMMSPIKKSDRTAFEYSVPLGAHDEYQRVLTWQPGPHVDMSTERMFVATSTMQEGLPYYDQQPPWYFGRQNKTKPVLESSPLYSSGRYGFRGAAAIRQYTTNWKGDPHTTETDSTPDFLRGNELLPQNDWVPRLVANKVYARGPAMSTPKLWPENALYPTGYKKKPKASSSWYNTQTTVNLTPRAAAAEQKVIEASNANMSPPRHRAGRDSGKESGDEEGGSGESAGAASEDEEDSPRIGTGSGMQSGARGRTATTRMGTPLSPHLTRALMQDADERDQLRASARLEAAQRIVSRPTTIRAKYSRGSPRTSSRQAFPSRGASRGNAGGDDGFPGQRPTSRAASRKANRQREKLQSMGKLKREFSDNLLRYSGAQAIVVNAKSGKERVYNARTERGGGVIPYAIRWREVMHLFSLMRNAAKKAEGGMQTVVWNLCSLFREEAMKGSLPAMVSRPVFIATLTSRVDHLSVKQASLLFSTFDVQQRNLVRYVQLMACLMILEKPNQALQEKLNGIWDLYETFSNDRLPLENANEVLAAVCASDAQRARLDEVIKSEFRRQCYRVIGLKRPAHAQGIGDEEEGEGQATQLGEGSRSVSGNASAETSRPSSGRVDALGRHRRRLDRAVQPVYNICNDEFEKSDFIEVMRHCPQLNALLQEFLSSLLQQSYGKSLDKPGEEGGLSPRTAAATAGGLEGRGAGGRGGGGDGSLHALF